jgi:hypothetical protein
MEVELTAPNGKKWTQPIGLFINNEFVKSSNAERIRTINPTYELAAMCGLQRGFHTDMAVELKKISALYMLQVLMMSTLQSRQLVRPSKTSPGSLLAGLREAIL